MLNMNQTTLFHRGYSVGGGGETQPSTVEFPGGPYQSDKHRH